MSLRSAKAQGLSVKHILNLLKNSAEFLPPSLERALNRWDDRGTEARINQVTVLRVSHPEILRSLKQSKAGRFLGDPLGPTATMVKRGAVEKVRRALAEMGFLSEVDFLGVGCESQSGDAIAVRFGQIGVPGGQESVVVIDGGFQATGPEIVAHIKHAMGGRAAEEIVFSQFSTGAANDLKQATDQARRMVCSYGMSEKIGPISLADDEHDVFLGRDFVSRKEYSERTANQIVSIRDHLPTSRPWSPSLVAHPPRSTG